MLSIVTLHLQRKEQTERFIKALYEMTEREFELIVVSQESDTETIAWLTRLQQEQKNFEIVWNEHNIGTAAGRNLGVSAASGEYIVFLDNDVEVTQGWLEPLIDTAQKQESIAAVGALILLPQGEVQYCSHYVVEYSENTEQHSIGLHIDCILKPDSPEIDGECEVPWYPTTCLLIKRQAFLDSGSFDEQLTICEEDKDLCLSLRQAGYKIFSNPASKVVHHSHPRTPAYAQIRESLSQTFQDKAFFEKKWNLKSIHQKSKRYLIETGMSDDEIAELEKFKMFVQVVS